jgi:PAS domain S-box-containing protein
VTVVSGPVREELVDAASCDRTREGRPVGYAPDPMPAPPVAGLMHLLERSAGLLPATMRPRRGFFLSFKNRILINTVLVMIGVVIVIGVALQVAIFPKIRGDSAAIFNLKIIHFLSSIVVVAASWLFIERISKRITLPLLELTQRADQISREAGAVMARPCGTTVPDPVESEADGEDAIQADEISQLTSSFNRMLAHLKASEARLRESEEKYRFLFDVGPSPKFVIDAVTLDILDVNARAEEEYQYTREELLTLNFADLGHDLDREQTKNRLESSYSSAATLLPVFQHRRKNATSFMVNFQARRTRLRDRPAIIAAVWDVTERLEKQAMLIQAGKMATLGEMATGIAHELNQPLNVIRLGSDYLVKKMRNRECVDLEDLGKITTELTGSVDRASRIINHLRQFGRKAEELMSPVNLNTPVLGVFTLLGTQLEARGIRWTMELGEGLPLIMGDGNRLEQVFINLVLNARDALLTGVSAMCLGDTPPDRVVTVRTFVEGEHVVATVSDTGPGIPPEIRSRVFEPFFTTKKIGEGTGLGLSISYGIIKEHRGTIEIDDQSHEGTTFRLSFPCLAPGDHHEQNPCR